MCGVGVPPGQACNDLVDFGATVVPSCTVAPMPVGTGGTIVDGIYKLTAQTYYNTSFCPTGAVSGSIAIQGGCLQSISGAPFVASASGTIAVQGNALTLTLTCVNAGMLTLMADAPTKTFTATATTVTFFSLNSAVGNTNPDRVEVYTRR